VVSQYVDATRLLEILFAKGSRPSLRRVRDQQMNHMIPFIKIGRRVFFDTVQVKAHRYARAIGRKR